MSTILFHAFLHELNLHASQFEEENQPTLKRIDLAIKLGSIINQVLVCLSKAKGHF